MLPTEASIADFARAIGLTERRVATVKAEGRLPVSSTGKVDLPALLRLGWTAALAAKGYVEKFPEPTEEELAAAKGLAPGLAFTEPMHRGYALAALIALHEAPINAAIAAAEAGVSRAQAEHLADLLLVMLFQQMNEGAASAGLPDAGKGGPLYANPTIKDWRSGVAWHRLFDASGAPATSTRIPQAEET